MSSQIQCRKKQQGAPHPPTQPRPSPSPAKLLPPGPMMWSFSTAMQVVQHTKPRDLPQTDDRPARCFLALPASALSAPLPRYYAFAVTEHFLADLARVAPRRERLRVPHPDGVQLTHHGLRLLRARTGAVRLFLTAGRAPPRGSSPPPPFVAPNGVVPLVAVCSGEPSSYRRRPSQEQMDRLERVLGSKPRWWIAFDRDMPRRPTDEVITSVHEG